MQGEAASGDTETAARCPDVVKIMKVATLKKNRFSMYIKQSIWEEYAI